ncbi:D-sedoheptulose 7-phosphate isomerase [Micromonospora pattaloongensis]|uniref:D-sedoheptulose 7-phosphate isomerase n=1 Tax=Micromonospora pattaloongensis TaxID=405436 RepID=A0A1H3RSK2_9ACTN|nr:SIS domain-containing protein [Micromonospora pattaloongensis]SDZ28676.1 D-sedoheptulose 7-phosphate isomerase [Micromonospora pattaloongensis]
MGRSADELSVAEIFDRRVAPVAGVADDAEAIARACHAMALRLQRGGKLIVFGTGAASTDAAHVAAEFVHPAVAGTRPLPAISLTADVATLTGIAERSGLPEIFARQIPVVAAADDVALGISTDGHSDSVLRGLRAARAAGLLTVGLTGGDGGDLAALASVDHLLIVRSHDPQVVKEGHVTIYHILAELVQVFLEQPRVPGTEALS